jgi:hypothetical protein
VQSSSLRFLQPQQVNDECLGILDGYLLQLGVCHRATICIQELQPLLHLRSKAECQIYNSEYLVPGGTLMVHGAMGIKSAAKLIHWAVIAPLHHRTCFWASWSPPSSVSLCRLCPASARIASA